MSIGSENKQKPGALIIIDSQNQLSIFNIITTYNIYL